MLRFWLLNTQRESKISEREAANLALKDLSKSNSSVFLHINWHKKRFLVINFKPSVLPIELNKALDLFNLSINGWKHHDGIISILDNGELIARRSGYWSFNKISLHGSITGSL